MISTMDISASALVAQRIRLNAIASNVANLSSVRNEDGDLEPYQARFAVFQTDETVSIAGSSSVSRTFKRIRCRWTVEMRL